ncbi:MAG TPA: GerMN domain-containing protein [Acidimicrobiia bacterium]
MRRVVAVFVGLVMVISACGGGATPGAEPTATTGSGVTPATAKSPTVTIEPAQSTSTTGAPTTTVVPTTTTLVSPTTTKPPATTTTTLPPADVAVVPYFYVDEAGHENRQGPFLLPVTRDVSATRAVARAAMEQLLAGPSDGEKDGVPSISTLIPDDVRLLGLTITDGIATVDLSAAFEATDDSAVVAQRVAQVVFTLSRFPTVQEVLFLQDGAAIKVPIGNGQIVDRPVNIGDFLEFAAALHVETPSYRGQGANPLHVMGFGAVFEAAFSYALTDDDGLIVAEGHAMTNNGTGWGGFDFTISYEVDQAQVGSLIVWANSAKDGSRIDIREYPVGLVP